MAEGPRIADLRLTNGVKLRFEVIGDKLHVFKFERGRCISLGMATSYEAGAFSEEFEYAVSGE